MTPRAELPRIDGLGPTPPASRPTPPALPFTQFVVKLHGRCNLACDYCYVYTMADQRWRTRPRAMPKHIVDRTAERIAEHATAHAIGRPEVILHGGDPLLCGPEGLRYAVTRIRAAMKGTAEPSFGLQTNGVLLDREFLKLFAELGVMVGVSLDGDRAAHDAHRPRHDGGGSHAAVARALELLGRPAHRALFGGLLCVVDAGSDPIAVYTELLRYRPPTVDFLLPHGNWSDPPPHRGPGTTGTPYADWLIAVFDRWYHAERRETGVRLFEEIVHVLLGGQSAVEGIGLSPTRIAVVETDGAIEQSDMLASAYEGAARTGLHVVRDAFDAALRHPGVVARQRGVDGVPGACRTCRWWRVCGGGLYPHRYAAGLGFANPSVYCPDLYRLIGHVHETLARDIAAALAHRASASTGMI